MSFRSQLDEVLEGWWDTRNGLIDEVRAIPSRQFDFRPTPEVKNVRELIQHILEVAMMMTGELAREDTNFRRAPWPKLLAMYAKPAYRAKTKRELIALLKSQMRDADRRLKEVGELSLLQFITRFDGEKGTKLAWLHHGIEQEMYHRGQITLYIRLMGLEPALTRRIRGG
jgi:uncharacterized damage-inducible protein DinB